MGEDGQGVERRNRHGAETNPEYKGHDEGDRPRGGEDERPATSAPDRP